jgi:hypothetical protein
MLAVLAYLEQQWRFVLLKGVWVPISLWSLGLALRTRAARTR